ncbi:hypothetical protein D1BOALGB6SA_10201 [Olavius sp. associated proteobacterium Delta 1]|nr:hypothetical protein D1BOALGB6SA_10201 [Olavius sp. associated proteobacterium Delta 1]
MNETVQEIKTLFAKNNIPVFGIEKSSHLENDAPGYRSSDSLPSAESMLCMGVPFPKGVFMKTKAFDASDAQMINHVTGVDDHSMYTCIKCVSMCPYTIQAQQ